MATPAFANHDLLSQVFFYLTKKLPLRASTAPNIEEQARITAKPPSPTRRRLPAGLQGRHYGRQKLMIH